MNELKKSFRARHAQNAHVTSVPAPPTAALATSVRCHGSLTCSVCVPDSGVADTGIFAGTMESSKNVVTHARMASFMHTYSNMRMPPPISYDQAMTHATYRDNLYI